MSREQISVLEVFKIGIGPSSSHTLGPWQAARKFVSLLREHDAIATVKQIKILLYGSLAKTGHGHGTDVAVMLGLTDEDPTTFDTSTIDLRIGDIYRKQLLDLGGVYEIPFNPQVDLCFVYDQFLSRHPNALTFEAVLDSGKLFSETYYSIGGGFVETSQGNDFSKAQPEATYPIERAEDLLSWCKTTGKKVSAIAMENEKVWRPEAETRENLLKIFNVLADCVYRGCHTSGHLPGGLNVSRRASLLSARLLENKNCNDFNSWILAIKEGSNSFQYTLDWVSCFALAVSEQNAAFGRVVTAPTNGAAGVIPAALLYYLIFCNGDSDDRIIQFLLTAGVIAGIFKKGSTISAAMGGCQAEIGVSSAMAAAALTECLGGSQSQVLMAAEIAMEHHLGLTCDPVGGLVQIPCIERNTMGAIKAITASQLALQTDPANAKVSLDSVVKTMWETAQDMHSKYKETADGGLAKNVPLSLSEC